ncbi:DUF2321 domain-containing protein [Bacillus piscicola]|uniref:DUF2321 domain-containing protein n=1 Tax=Bacillus piscicola TaxID=1632684 RepID=UPI001F099D48|nr:DUF2321 domain-containing protein [Bacillus piscicola]
MSESWYDTAQICLNGHEINTGVTESPERNQRFCDKCGEKTITKCPSCNFNIRGNYNVPGVAMLGFTYSPPKHCYNCGDSYPWTKRALEAANELAEEIDQLSPEEQQNLKKSFNDLVNEGPKTEVATTRFKKLMNKAGPETGNAFRNIFVDLVSETVKKSIWG